MEVTGWRTFDACLEQLVDILHDESHICKNRILHVNRESGYLENRDLVFIPGLCSRGDNPAGNLPAALADVYADPHSGNPLCLFS